MRTLKTVLLLLFVSSILLAQAIPNLPADGLVGHWTFDDGASLESALVGNDLEQAVHDEQPISFIAVDGPEAGNGAVNIGLGSFYRCFHDIEANGFDPDNPDVVPERVNQYTLVMDIHVPQLGVWYGLHAGNNNADPDASDFESFIKPSGVIGVGTTGYSYYQVDDTEGWYRLIISSDLGNSYLYYLDGQLLQDGGEMELDNKFSLDSPDGSNQMLLFGDNDGEDAPIDVAEVVLYDRALTPEEMEAIGGYGHIIPFGSAYGVWDFDDNVNLVGATVGKDLIFEGEILDTNGPTTKDAAALVPTGGYINVEHDIVANGNLTNGDPTKVNAYTVSMDVKVGDLGKFYSLFQTNPANTDDADLFIDPDGSIGSSDLGWSDTTIAKILPGEWHRISYSVSLSDSTPDFILVLDGDSLLAVDGLTFDGDLALAPKDGDNSVLFFADDNAEDNEIAVASLSIFNRKSSVEELVSLGGYEHEFSTEATPAQNTLEFKVSENTQYAKAPYSEDFDIPVGRDFTVEVWVKIGLGISGDPSIISNKSWDSGGNDGWNIAAKDDSWDLNIADTTRARNDWDLPSINDGQWHHIGFSLDRQVDSLFVFTDDIMTVKLPLADGETILGSVINRDELPLCFAQDGTEAYPSKYPGMIDEARIWHAALTAEELREWRHKEINSSHPHYDKLVGYWKFNEGTGNTFTDLSGKGHNAELVNAPAWRVSYAPLMTSDKSALYDVSAIWAAVPEATSGALTMSSDFGNASLARSHKGGDNLVEPIEIESFVDERYAAFGHDGARGVGNGGLAQLASDVEARLNRVWYLDKTNTFEEVVDIAFNFNSTPGEKDNYYILLSTTADGPFMAQAKASSVTDTQVIFSGIQSVNAGQHTDQVYVTLGSKNLATSPLENITSLEDEATPFTYSLSNAYPNPFNPTTTINYSLAKQSDVKITIYNTLGQVVTQLIDLKKQPAGRYNVAWDANSFTSGLYFFKIQAADFTQTRKMMLIK